MKIEVSITRQYDTESDDHGHLFEGVKDPVALALRYFIDDLTNTDDYALIEQSVVKIDGINGEESRECCEHEYESACACCIGECDKCYKENGYEMSDVEADADTLASAGWGTDEDYGG